MTIRSTMRWALTGLLAIAVLAVALPGGLRAQQAAADPARLAAARELMAAQGGVEQARKGLSQMTEAIVAQVRQSNPSEAEGLARFFTKFISIDNPKVKKYLDDVFETSVQFYAEKCSADEMKAMTTFLGTPAGKKFVSLAPEAGARLAPLIVQFQQTLMADVQAAYQRGEFKQ